MVNIDTHETICYFFLDDRTEACCQTEGTIQVNKSVQVEKVPVIGEQLIAEVNR